MANNSSFYVDSKPERDKQYFFFIFENCPFIFSHFNWKASLFHLFFVQNKLKVHELLNFTPLRLFQKRDRCYLLRSQKGLELTFFV